MPRQQLEAKRPQAAAGTQVADVLRLAKAMPSSADQPGLVLELDRLARSTGVTLGSITPSDPVLGAGGATTIPVVVTAEGSYREITRFLQRTSRLVTFRRGEVLATGRLFTLQAVELSESNANGFPLLDATITLNAFVYDGPIVPATPPAEHGRGGRGFDRHVRGREHAMTPEARAARERKQKIFVVVGGLLLVGLLAIQLPKLLGGSSTPEAASSTETTATAQPSSTPVALAGSGRDAGGDHCEADLVHRLCTKGPLRPAGRDPERAPGLRGRRGAAATRRRPGRPAPRRRRRSAPARRQPRSRS